MNKIIVSATGTIASAALALLPMPFHQWANLRVAGAVGAVGFSIAGCCVSDREKQQQLAIDKWQFQKSEEQRLISEATRPVVIETAVTKIKNQAEYALADHRDDMSVAYTESMIEKHGEAWVRSQLPQSEQEPEQVALPEPGLPAIPEVKQNNESFTAKKAKLLKLISEHENGWIGQCMKKPILIYGDQGSGKSYFAEFLALCRHYLRGHEIVSIADPHFHQNREYCWQNLVKLKVPGYGANHNYQEVNSQILAMYEGFAVRTLKSKPQTPIFDEVTRYGQEEATKELAAKLGSKLSSDPRKANCSPILIAHAKTLAALGGGEGFAEAIQGNFIRIKLNSDSEQEPLWRGTISGIKDDDGEVLENVKITIREDWIRSSWVYDLFNSDDIKEVSEIADTPIGSKKDSQPDVNPTFLDSAKFDRMMQGSNRYLAESTPEFLAELKRKWLEDTTTPEVEITSTTTPWDEKKSDNLADNLADNQTDKLSDSENDNLEPIILQALPREDYPIIWTADDFARLLPNESESALFDKILELSDKLKTPSKIIQKGLKFTQARRMPRSYIDMGKRCFCYLVRKYGSASMIATYKDYLDSDF